MVPEIEKPRITEIQVRMDCNGCVQKIKKALHGINGIYDVSIDFPQQKLTVIGWADPEKIIKAIKKTRKIVAVCVHPETSEAEQQNPAAPAEGGQPPQEAKTETPPAEPTPTAEPPKEPPPPEKPPQEATPLPAPANASPREPAGPSEPKDVEAIHIIHHHPRDYGYMYPNGRSYIHESPQYVTHSYSNYKPSPYISAYVSDYARSPSPPQNIRYSRTEHYADDYHSRGDGSNITSMFSDENPNACRIV